MDKAKEFLILCKEFIKAQKEYEKNSGLVEKDDFSILYRFICWNGWEHLENLKQLNKKKRLFG